MSTQTCESLIQQFDQKPKDDFTGQKKKEKHRTNETHWTSEDWKHTETKKSPYELRVLSTVGLLGGNLVVEVDEPTQYPVYGEEIYLANRHLIEQIKLVELLLESLDKKTDDKKTPKTKEKKMSKIDKIRLETATKKTSEEYKKLLESFNWKKLNIIQGLQTNRVIELRGITLMYISAYFMRHLSDYKKAKNLPQVYELIIGIGKFINIIKNYSGKSIIDPSKNENVSPTMIKDLQNWETKLKNSFDYDGSRICDVHPKLFVECDYDQYIPMAEVKPYKSQENLMNLVKKATKLGFLISYKAMTNSGKTTMVVPLALYLTSLRQTKAEYTGVQLIYSCNTQTVQFDVSCNLYNMQIKFAYAYSKWDGSIGITNHFICKRDEERVVIVCSPKVAAELLKKNPDKYWLFLDEPTSGADCPDILDLNKNTFLRDNIAAISQMPKHTILCSATNPSFDKLEPIVSNYKSQYPNGVIDTVYSNEIYIGCEVKTEQEEYLMPHQGAKNKQELLTRITTINKVPFLGRLYTHRVVLKLWNDLKPHIKELPDITTIFSNIENLKMDKIRQVALSMLQLLAKQSDELIAKVCSSSLTPIQETKVDSDDEESEEESDDDFQFEDVKEVKEKEFNNAPLDLSLIGTYHGYKYLGNNVVFTDNPVAFITKAFKTLLDELTKENISVKKIFDKYEKQYDIWQKSKSRVATRTKNEDKKSMEMQDISDSAPIMDFPPWARINTLEHIKKFAKSQISTINPKMVRTTFPLETIPRDSQVDDELMTLLMCGVGIYTNDFKIIDKVYLDYVMQLASTGNLTYIIADSSMSYGANYPINRVFIAEDFCKNHSIDTIFQSISRAGRVGKSWIAQSIVPNALANEIIKYSRNGGEDYGLMEAKNMNAVFKIMTEVKVDTPEEMEKYFAPEVTTSKKATMTITFPNVTETKVTKKEEDSEDEDSWENMTTVPISQVLPKKVEAKKTMGLPFDKPLFSGPVRDINTNWRNKSAIVDPPMETPRQPVSESKKYIPPHQRRK